jgi:hypothetical protein
LWRIDDLNTEPVQFQSSPIPYPPMPTGVNNYSIVNYVKNISQEYPAATNGSLWFKVATLCFCALSIRIVATISKHHQIQATFTQLKESHKQT